MTLNYSVTINNSPEIVWQKLWNDDSYKKWTSAFMEGSYAESSWEEGAKILFLSPGKNGMTSIIQKKVPNKEMTFKHLGEIKNGVEEMKDWKNATESYQLSEKDGGTLLNVVLNMDEEHKEFGDYFNATFPKALQILKEISEM